ncbi:MAG: SPOR domain-containing protein [Prevotella sp.]|nr:SPOR domain-containing protein [Prevotella sp.]
MRRIISIFILCVGMVTHANAQTFTDRVQKKAEGKGTVTIHQSTDIDQLVNDPTATGVQQPAKSNDGKKTEPSKDNGTQTKNPTTAQQTPLKSEVTDANTQPTTTATRKITGYRVQAFAGGNSRKDRQMAEQARNNIRAQFPNIAVYVHFYSPRWICRVGNFRTYEEAHQMMVRLQNMGYKQASIVKGKISVAY